MKMSKGVDSQGATSRWFTEFQKLDEKELFKLQATDKKFAEIINNTTFLKQYTSQFASSKWREMRLKFDTTASFSVILETARDKLIVLKKILNSDISVPPIPSSEKEFQQESILKNLRKAYAEFQINNPAPWENALAHFIETGDFERIQILFDLDLDCNAFDTEGTPLIFSIFKANLTPEAMVTIADRFIEHGLDFNQLLPAQKNLGFALLSRALETKIEDLISLILKKQGILFENPNDSGQTSLHLLVKNGQYSPLHSLLEEEEAKDLVDFQDDAGNTALHIAVTRLMIEKDLGTHESVENCQVLQKIITLLVSVGANFETVNNEGISPKNIIEGKTITR